MKLKETFFNDSKILLLEQMQDGPLYILLLLKFYLISLPYNSLLLVSENMPHTFQTLAIVTRYQVGTVERAIKIFLKFGLIEILANRPFYMTDIQLFIGQSSTEAERKRMERLRLQQQLPSSTVRADICPPEIEIRYKERDSDKVRVREKEGQPIRSAFGAYQNVFLSDSELVDVNTKITLRRFVVGPLLIRRKAISRRTAVITAWRRAKLYERAFFRDSRTAQQGCTKHRASRR